MLYSPNNTINTPNNIPVLLIYNILTKLTTGRQQSEANTTQAVQCNRGIKIIANTVHKMVLINTISHTPNTNGALSSSLPFTVGTAQNRGVLSQCYIMFLWKYRNTSLKAKKLKSRNVFICIGPFYTFVELSQLHLTQESSASAGSLSTPWSSASLSRPAGKFKRHLQLVTATWCRGH